MEERTIVYFDAAGPQNTDIALACALRRAKEGDIRYIVVASSSGETALRLGEEARREGYQGKIVVCTYHAGFSGGDAIALPPERRALLEAMGMTVVQGLSLIHNL
ncbi:MAG: hypothetical protein N2205_09440, partial [Candidatus Caldatribacterium sp.]|nr:hypothetical protein [Candidatus Caldatribacterium sp.]